MRLSILIPVYNVAPFLPPLLDALLPDLPPQAEVVFWDDVSPDDSCDIIRDYQARYPHQAVRLLHAGHNLGLTRARQALLDAAAGDYVWFVDSDDLVEPGAAAAILAVLDTHAPDVLLFDYTVFYDADGRTKAHERLKLPLSGCRVDNQNHALYRLAVLDGKHYFWNKVFLRRRIDGVVAFEIPAFEDIAYTPVLLDGCRHYYYLPQALVHYRIRGDSIAQTVGVKQVYGLTAYWQQAEYCRNAVRDDAAYAHLLYKAVVYYYRIKDKAAGLPENQRQAVMTVLEREYARKPCSTAQAALLLLRQGRVGKALKLMALVLRHR